MINKYLRHLAQTSTVPIGLEISRADGNFLYDKNGKGYLDLISGISVSNIGHSHPRITEAIQEQLDKHSYLMVFGEYVQDVQVELAGRLCELLPNPIDQIYFVNSGSEAVEGALKLAKRFTGRPNVVSFENAYHGSTAGALSVMGNEVFKNAFRPLVPGISILPFNSNDHLNKIDTNTAAVIIEPIQGEAGVRVGGKDFLEALRNRCDEVGALLIFDEIQSGFGRTGKMFAFEHYDVTPDVLLMAKALGGGMPLGAFAASEKIMSALNHDPILGHITTFGGHPVSCAASLAMLDVIQENDMLNDVEEKANMFRSQLKHPSIMEIRNKGFLMAVEFGDNQTNLNVISHCIENGVITDWFLFCDTAMRISPPLTITAQEVEYACDVIKAGLR